MTNFGTVQEDKIGIGIFLLPRTWKHVIRGKREEGKDEKKKYS